METPQALLIGHGEKPCLLQLGLANRHGLVAGATGTGKTITLQVMAEGFARAGVPVFCADVKGDLSGIALPGKPNPKLAERASALGVADYALEGAPVVFWDLFGEKGHPIRATVAEMGPLLLARMLELNDTQEGVLNIAFKLADDEGLLLLDFKDLTAILQFVAERADELTTAYGNVSKATIGTIQRRLLTLEQQGAEQFMGEPALDLADLMLLAPDGRGAINVLMADRLIQSPRLYATFLLWLMSELFEELPEVGDLDKPKLVFFFDEAHLLFSDAPKALIEKVEQVVRLIRSKGVGIYFVTQNPADVPPTVLGQLGNRVQHALRAFTPIEQKAVRVAAETFRPNPAFKTEEAITQLAVGEALVSMLEPGGIPGIVERARICPPRSRMGPLSAEERQAVMAHSPVGPKYAAGVDREFGLRAFAEPRGRGARGSRAAQRLGRRCCRPADPGLVESLGRDTGERDASAPRRTSAIRSRAAAPQPAAPSGGLGEIVGAILGGDGRRQSVAEALAKSVARSVGSQLGRQITRGILGSILKR